MEDNTHKRLDYIDIAKGIAMICIILGHLKSNQINRVVFTFHVPIFFLITGYFIKAEKDTKMFIKNKARTLIIPYICTCALIIILTILKGLIKGNALVGTKDIIFAALYGAGDKYTDPFYIPSIGAIWFLLASFWGCIFVKLSLKLNKYIRALLIAGLFLVGQYTTKLFWFPFSIQAGACATLYIYLGYLIKQNKEVIENISKEMKIVTVIFAFVIWIEFIANFKSFWLVHCDIGRGFVDIFGSICACLIVICISKLIDNKTKISRKVLSYFGRYSLLILCIHATELLIFPWGKITDYMTSIGIEGNLKLLVMIVLKLTLNLSLTFLLSKIRVVRKVLGYKENL